MRPRIETVVDDLLDEVEDGRVDMMEALSDPLPTIVIAELIGVPVEDRARFKVWSDAVARQLEPTITRAQSIEAFKANAELREYFDAIIEERRAEPREDLLSALIAAEEEGDKLTHEEMVSTLILLLVAGNETTTNLIGNGLLALLRHPDQLERLRDNPDLMGNAIEELLRYDSPVQTDARTTTEDVVIGGQEIKAGQQLILLLGSATTTPASSTSRTGSTSTVTCVSTSPSRAATITASDRRWRGRRARLPSSVCSRASATCSSRESPSSRTTSSCAA